jgi:hypothetical protein
MPKPTRRWNHLENIDLNSILCCTHCPQRVALLGTFSANHMGKRTLLFHLYLED